MDYNAIGYVALGLLAIYLTLRFMEQYAFKKIARTEVEHILNSDEHKVKGRYG